MINMTTVLKFCTKYNLSLTELNQTVQELYLYKELNYNDNIAHNLIKEILAYISNKKNNAHCFKNKTLLKEKDRRSKISCYVTKEPAIPNRKRVEIPTPFGGKVSKR